MSNTVVPVFVGDTTLFVDALDESMAALLRGEPYEPVETALFLRELQHGDVVVDVGANVGHYALLAGRAVGPSGRVYAFEPNPAAYKLLAQGVKANGYTHVITFAAAVGERSGRAELWFDPRNSALASLDNTNARRVGSAVDVEMVSLDDFAAREAIAKVNALKIDAQGAEGMILDGAVRLLEAHRPTIFIELWPAGLKNLGSSVETILRRLAQFDYTFMPIGTTQACSVDGVLMLCEAEGGIDLIARSEYRRRPTNARTRAPG